jgi:2-methylcitrate dehydratase PrpD
MAAVEAESVAVVDGDVFPVTVSEQLASWALDFSAGDAPPDVVAKAKLHILDALGIAMAASRFRYGRILADLVVEQSGAEQATAVPFGFRTTASQAALLIGSLIHGLDYDDTHMESITHPGAPIVAAALAVAEREGASGRDFLEAVIVGFEAICRIGRAPAGRIHQQGFHATGVCGTLASAISAAKLMRLGPAATADAVGIAGTFAGGSAQVIREGGASKTLSAGRAAEAGIIAALLAKGGFPGIRNVIEGELGFLYAHAGAGRYDVARVLEGLGREWTISEVEFKHFPAGFAEHPFMDAATKLKREHDIKADEIAELIYGDWARLIPLASEPAARKRRPQSGYEAKFSRYYCIASVFVEDQVTVHTFSDERVTDPRILHLAACTRYEIDDEHRWLKVRMTDGREFFQIQDAVEPMSGADLETKFRRNCEGVLPAVQADAALHIVESIDRQRTMGGLVAALCHVEPVRGQPATR